MGTWGAGNLDSDSACDYRAERSTALGERVWKPLQDDESTEADEDLYSQLFVDLEWLLTLEKADLFSGWGLPPVAELDPVVERWLTLWADYFDGLSGPEFKAERRAVIEASFAQYRAVCAKWEAVRAG